jgi:hypothetical protein
MLISILVPCSAAARFVNAGSLHDVDEAGEQPTSVRADDAACQGWIDDAVTASVQPT